METDFSACGARESTPTSVSAFGADSHQSAFQCGSQTDPRWFCVQAHTRSERVASIELARQGFDTFWPRFRHPQRRTLHPLFPGYLFVRFDRDAQQWRPIVSTVGVKRLFSTSADRPSPVPHGIVERMIEDGGGNGIINDDAPDPRQIPLQVGSLAIVLDGPFTSFVGICEWSDSNRVRLLLNIFGRSTVSELRRSDVDFAA